MYVKVTIETEPDTVQRTFLKLEVHAVEPVLSGQISIRRGRKSDY